MKFDQNWVIKNEPCAEALTWLKTLPSDDGTAVLTAAMEINRFEWVEFALMRSLTKENSVRWAIYCAELCLANFEKEYPNDNRPRAAIEAAKLVLAKDTEANRTAASSAARSADSAARSADSAAADSAAYSAYSAAKKELYLFAVKLLETQNEG